MDDERAAQRDGIWLNQPRSDYRGYEFSISTSALSFFPLAPPSKAKAGRQAGEELQMMMHAVEWGHGITVTR